METVKNATRTLTIGNNLRKVENGLILDIEQGTSLGISFLNHETQEMKTFQLDAREKEILIKYLKRSANTFTRA